MVWRDCRLASNGSDVEKNLINVDIGFTHGLSEHPIGTELDSVIRWKSTGRTIKGILRRNTKYFHGIEGFMIPSDWPQPPDAANFEITYAPRGTEIMNDLVRSISTDCQANDLDPRITVSTRTVYILPNGATFETRKDAKLALIRSDLAEIMNFPDDADNLISNADRVIEILRRVR